MTQHRGATLLLASVLLLISSLATTTRAAMTAAGSYTDDKLPANRSYAHCAALGKLGTTLHWTYDAKTALLSLAFVAPPAPGANGTGWVSWALNPTGDGMKGAQALVAFKRGKPPTYVATDLAADESGGKVRLYGKLRLHQGMEVVNHIWNVGSTVTDGAPAKHALGQENLNAKGRLVLSGSAASTYVSAPVLMLLGFAGFLAIA
uniref:AIR12 DOMON domain-containing protein n=1 Tax=Setaria italica TaxID=4555 RepID=K4A0G8_SETIT